MLQAMLDGGRAILHSFGVFDERPIEVRATFVSILRMRRPLDVCGHGAVRAACFFHVKNYVTHDLGGLFFHDNL